MHFKQPPRSGLLFDLDTGEVLWRRHPARQRPIASLTKMMTALLVVDRARPAAVLITRQALAYTGSGVGVLPRGKRIKVETMLYGLLLPSGNDAAIALAQRISGTVPRFVASMSAQARELGLSCTRFSTPRGSSTAATTRARSTSLCSRARARPPAPGAHRPPPRGVLPFPIKGGKLFLFNNNPLLRLAIRARSASRPAHVRRRPLPGRRRARHGRRLGVVLLALARPRRPGRRGCWTAGSRSGT